MDFINIYIMISIFYYSIYILYMLNIQTYITCIIHDLHALKAAKKIQMMGCLQVDDLFTTNSLI